MYKCQWQYRRKGGGGGGRGTSGLAGGRAAHRSRQSKDGYKKFLVTQEKSTDSVEAGAAAQESVDSVEGATTPSVTSSSRHSSSYLSGTFPNDLPVLVSTNKIFWLKVPPSLVIVHFLGINLAMVICHSTLPGTMPRRPKDGWSTPLKATRCIILCVVYLKVK